MQQSHRNTITRHRRCFAASWALIGLLLNPVLAAADDRPLSVPVKRLGTPEPAPPMDPTMMVREAPPQATPGARMPQYQLHHQDRNDNADFNSPNLRFILALPDRPILVEAQITIDGTPFGQARERRVQEIMKYIADPAAYKAAVAKAEAERAASIAASEETKSKILNSITGFFSGFIPESKEPEVSGKTLAAGEETPPTPDDTALKPEETAPEAKAEEPIAEEAKPEEPSVPAVDPYTAPATIYDRIDRYATATGQAPTVEEVRWLLTTWIDGPVLLFLNDNFQRFRADQKPVFKILDRDRDGKISADELAKAVTAFQECDLDRNEVVESTELAKVADDPRDKADHNSSGKIIFRLPDATTAAATYRRLAVRYAEAGNATLRLPRFDTDNDGKLSPDELQRLNNCEADIRITIEFNTTSANSSQLTITGFGSEFTGLQSSAKLNSSSVTLDMGKFYLEFLAGQSGSSDQISVGAVNDGYEMLPELDPDNDGRFSIRELRQLNDRLKTFDYNKDGELTVDESHPTFRICFGLGPVAHQSLALLRETADPALVVAKAGPDWFQQMDKNNDHDLTRKEFPGTDEQFRQLDSDSDELISAVEASESEKQ